MNRKQRRTLAAIKRKGLGVSLPQSNEDAIKQKYFHKCAQLGELIYNLDIQEGIKLNLLGEIRDLTKQYKDAQEANKPVSKTDSNQSTATGSSVEGASTDAQQQTSSVGVGAQSQDPGSTPVAG